MLGWATQPLRGFCEGLVIKALGTWLARYRTEALACASSYSRLVGDVRLCAARRGVGTYLLVDATALLRSRGKAASHGEMRCCTITAGGQLEW